MMSLIKKHINLKSIIIFSIITLLLLLPIHTPLLTFSTSSFKIPALLSLWKEVILLIITSISIYQIAKSKSLKKVDLFILFLITAVNLIIFLNSFVFNEISLKVFFIAYRF